jgi:hypothetical protein
LAWLTGNDRIQRLENYYANDDPLTGWNPAPWGSLTGPTYNTQETFAWRNGIDINQEVDWGTRIGVPSSHITQHPYFNPECECLVVLILNTRRKIKGHYFVSVGTMDTILCHPREIFRLAIMASASSIVIMHNHPSGESQPSEADIKITRDLIRGGQLLKIDVVDHVVIGLC